MLSNTKKERPKCEVIDDNLIILPAPTLWT